MSATRDDDGRALYDLWRQGLNVPPWDDLGEPRRERWRRIAEAYRAYVAGTLKWTDVWSEIAEE